MGHRFAFVHVFERIDELVLDTCLAQTLTLLERHEPSNSLAQEHSLACDVGALQACRAFALR